MKMWIPEGQCFLARLYLTLEATVHRTAMMSGFFIFCWGFFFKREHNGGFIGETTGAGKWRWGVAEGKKKGEVVSVCF